eukprot:CAMPEP_0173411052 /NCGR_PEP_ID=MMETSP1356-20130122/76033_1 /TAXON_ID=77927 ORGANISM="Hemiselmis virescens, Strain PCC157" /NCGR_SAMPLE_ID=MMETSP1356 /ASSEMBLY_ACC=CAM_ASM_000847 /LENGTH=198 /DNA_ID=CAMNT_0014372751 /DNA_START=114 /DNA_END=707 /DNA_ORIENTATION=+
MVLDDEELLMPRNMAIPLPWPRGQPPRFPGDKKPDFQKPHWKLADVVKCGQCGSVLPCVHKTEHAKRVNNKFAPDVKQQLPDFMRENQQWREQLKQERESNGGRLLPIGSKVRDGVRHGWGSFPGHDATMGSPRSHGEWRLVFVPKTEEELASEVRSLPGGRPLPKKKKPEVVLSPQGAAARSKSVLQLAGEAELRSR